MAQEDYDEDVVGQFLPQEYQPDQPQPRKGAVSRFFGDFEEQARREAGGMQPKGDAGADNPTNATPAPAPKADFSTFNREGFKNDWVAKGNAARTSADMDQYLRDHPEYAPFVSRSGKDKWAIADPRGTEYVDALFDESGANAKASWTDPGGQGGGGGVGMGQLPPGGAAGMSAPAGGGVYGTGNQAVDDEMHKALLSLLQRGQKPVTAEDMGDKFGPISGIMQRNAQEARHAAAERAAFQGTNIGGAGGELDAEQNKISESLAQDESGLMANLMREEYAARRQDLSNALQFAQGEERIRLQKQLADMDNEISRLGLQQRGEQFNAQLGENQRQFDESMDNSDAWKEYYYDQAFNQALV